MSQNAQRLSVRVYYEDTDFSGRVYHASYFRFLERGRTEWLRGHGLTHDSLAEARGLAFAVTNLQASFHAAAAIDALLDVVTELGEMRGPVFTFRQSIACDGASLLSATVDVVTIKGARPARPPREILAAFAQFKRQWPGRCGR